MIAVKSFLGKLFGRKPEPPSERPRMSVEAHEKACADTQEAMDRHWAKVGDVEEDVIAYVIPPIFQGGPAWPTLRQAYRVIRRPGSIIIATDGMSDPYEHDGEENGFGMELFMETRDIPADFTGADGDVSALKNSWAFELLENCAAFVAEHGGVRDHVDQLGSISTEIPGVAGAHAVGSQVPDRFVLDDSIGLLIGGPPPDFPDIVEDTPFRPVRLIPLVVLTAAELQHVRTGDSQVRRALAERLSALPQGHFSDLRRPSVI